MTTCSVTTLNAGQSLGNGKIANKEWSNSSVAPFVLDSVSDHEGNIYDVVEIGSGTSPQCWLKESMRCTTLPSGQPVRETMVRTFDIPSYDRYVENMYNYICGITYNWVAALDVDQQSPVLTFPHRGICPLGWHIPTRDEMQTLVNVANREAFALAGDYNWNVDRYDNAWPDGYANPRFNIFGFSALPAGQISLGYGVDFWTATQRDNEYVLALYFYANNPRLFVSAAYKNQLFFVRCIRD